MSESNMHSKNPYPQGVGVGSVPVLFSLKNVQPKMLGGIANSNTKSNNSTDAAKPESATSAISPTVGRPAESAKPAPLISKNNRPYNIVVGLLILVLCFLVLRNSQGAKSGSKSEIASSSTSINLAQSIPVTNSKVESVPRSIPNGNENRPLEFVPSEVAKSPTPSEHFPESRAVENWNAVQEHRIEGQLLIQAKPSLLPPLLTSSRLETQAKTSPTTGNVDDSIAPSQSVIRLPKAVLTDIVDTNAQPPSTRDLIHLHELGKQFSSQSTTVSGPSSRGTAGQGVQASTGSYIVPAVVGHSPYTPIMSGRPYPSLPKEYPPLTIPGNEQIPLERLHGIAGPMQDTLPIWQPSNSYQYLPQSTKTPIPYTPMAPLQNGNSVGYPPEN